MLTAYALLITLIIGGINGSKFVKPYNFHCVIFLLSFFIIVTKVLIMLLPGYVVSPHLTLQEILSIYVRAFTARFHLV